MEARKRVIYIYADGNTHYRMKVVDREKERKSKGEMRNLSIFWKPYDSTKLACAPEVNVNLINLKQPTLT